MGKNYSHGKRKEGWPNSLGEWSASANKLQSMWWLNSVGIKYTMFENGEQKFIKLYKGLIYNVNFILQESESVHELYEELKYSIGLSKPHSFYFLRSFYVNHFLKSWLNFLQYCFFFYVLVFWPSSMWDLRSLTKDWTCTPFIIRWYINHWTTREVPEVSLLKPFRG